MLSQALANLQLHSFVHTRNEFTAPWGFRIDWPPPTPPKNFFGDGTICMPPPPPSMLSVGFYIVTAGRCIIEIDKIDEPIALGSGDLVLFPNESGHQLRDVATSPVTPMHQVLTPETFKQRGCLRFGGGGETTRLLCGAFFLREMEDDHLVRLIRPVVHLRSGRGESDLWLASIVSVLNHETVSFGVGAQAVIDRLAHAIFIHAIREKIRESSQDDLHHLFKAGGHPQISKALELMRNSPNEHWTLESLAAKVQMSRSAFAAKFTTIVGEPPAKHLTRLRMNRAKAMLSETTMSVKEIAARLGYDAETAFSTAFKRWHQVSPMQSRKLAGDARAMMRSGA